MATGTPPWDSIDAYIAAAPVDRRPLLETLRVAIQAAAPDATETISYNMPAFAQNGILVYFATMKNYIGFYPTSGPIAAFEKDLAAYKTTKGAIHFPVDRPLPLDLIGWIVRFRVEQTRREAPTTRSTLSIPFLE